MEHLTAHGSVKWKVILLITFLASVRAMPSKCFAHTCLPNCDLHERDEELGTYVECYSGVKHLVDKTYNN